MRDKRLRDLEISEIKDLFKYSIETEDQLEESLSAAKNMYCNEFCILDIHLDIHDGSPALQRLTEVLGKKVQ